MAAALACMVRQACMQQHRIMQAVHASRLAGAPCRGSPGRCMRARATSQSRPAAGPLHLLSASTHTAARQQQGPSH